MSLSPFKRPLTDWQQRAVIAGMVALALLTALGG